MTLGEANVTGDASEVLPGKAGARVGSGGWRKRAVVVGVCVVVAWFYWWTARSSSGEWNFGAEQRDYYNLLLDGWLEGRLHMKVDVPPALLSLPDPYDPAIRPGGLGLHDASFYRGRYYLYFGAAPVVTLLLPFRLITGTDLPLPAAVLLFTFAGFVASAAAWTWIWRRYFPSIGIGLNVLCLLALATASMGPVLIRRANIWELPLSSGYCFAMLAVLSGLRSLHGESRRATLAWFAGSGLFLGLAVGSKPTYLFGLAFLLGPVVFAWWKGRSTEDSRCSQAGWLSLSMAGACSVGVVLAAIAWHNHARFGSPSEFGVRYQFSGIYEAKARHFAFDYVPFNVALYFFQPAAWSRYFPFFHPTPPPIRPEGYFGYEEVFGLLPNVPLVAVAFLAPLALPALARSERGRFGAWLAATGALGLGVLGVLLCFYAAMGRYLADFVPALVLLACIGAVASENILRARPASLTGIALRGLLRGAIVFSVFFAVMWSMRLYGNLRRLNPAAYAAMARVGNYPAHAWESLMGVESGPIEIDVRFKPVAPGTREVLLATGWHGGRDTIFVQHDSDDFFRIGFVHDEGAEVLSPPMPTAAGRTHRIRIAMGSLYPPEEHPAFHRFTRAETRRLTRGLRVSIDGNPVLQRYQRFHPASPGAVFIGGEPGAPGMGRRFSGEILGVRREGAWRATVADGTEGEVGAIAADEFDALALELVWPQRPAGTREALVVTGETGRADFLFVEYLEPSGLRFLFDHWGKPMLQSPVVSVQEGKPHRLEVALGAFPRAQRSGSDTSNRLEIRLDGRLVWQAESKFYAAEAADVFVGRNPIGGSGPTAAFSGTIIKVTPLSRGQPVQ